MNTEAYSEIFKARAKGQKNLGSNIASELMQHEMHRKDYQIALKAAMACADVRENLTAPIKAKIQEGSYQVSADDFAEKLLRSIQK